MRPNIVRIVRAYDGVRTILAEAPFDWSFDIAYPFEVAVAGVSITCRIGAITLEADDVSPHALRDGGVALILAEGALSTNEIRISGRASTSSMPVRKTGHTFTEVRHPRASPADGDGRFAENIRGAAES